jgi:hypothetical protein
LSRFGSCVYPGQYVMPKDGGEVMSLIKVVSFLFGNEV